MARVNDSRMPPHHMLPPKTQRSGTAERSQHPEESHRLQKPSSRVGAAWWDQGLKTFLKTFIAWYCVQVYHSMSIKDHIVNASFNHRNTSIKVRIGRQRTIAYNRCRSPSFTAKLQVSHNHNHSMPSFQSISHALVSPISLKSRCTWVLRIQPRPCCCQIRGAYCGGSVL